MTTETQAPEGALRTALADLLDECIGSYQAGTLPKSISLDRLTAAQGALAAPAPAEVAGEIVEMEDGALVPVWRDGTPPAGTKLYAQPKAADVDVAADVRELSKWLNEEPNRPLDRAALARVLAAHPKPKAAEGDELRATISRIVSTYVDSPMLVDELCFTLSKAQPKVMGGCIACEMRDAAIGQQPSQDVTPEFMAWLESKSRSAGVAANEAWNAGVAWVRSQDPAPAPELAAVAHLETLMTDLADAVFYRDVDKIPGIRKSILEAATQAPAVVDGLIGGEDPEVIRQKLRTLDVTMGGDGESVLSEVIDAATRCLSQQDAVAWRMNLHEGTNAEPRWHYVEMGSPVPGKFTLQKVYTRPQSERLHTFVNAAAGDGLVLGGVDAADLYVELFPERYAAAVAQIDTGAGEPHVPVQGSQP